MRIKITDLTPLLHHGYVAMNQFGNWYWYGREPRFNRTFFDPWPGVPMINLSAMFDIEPFKGDFTQSLMKVGEKQR